jgi:hypothetical protein
MAKKTVENIDPDLRKKGNAVFQNMTIDKVYFTSDNTAFSDKAHAEIHSINLEDKQIIVIKREEIE